MSKIKVRDLFLLGVFFALGACSQSEQPIEVSEPGQSDASSSAATDTPAAATAGLQLQALEWRNVGPFNGGRGTTVVGHPTDKMVFYFGHSSGGLWKTEDAGTTWEQVCAGQLNYASVGAMAIY